MDLQAGADFRSKAAQSPPQDTSMKMHLDRAVERFGGIGWFQGISRDIVLGVSEDPRVDV